MRAGKRGESLTAEKMKKCVWLRPEANAQIRIFWNGRKRIGFGIRNLSGCAMTKAPEKLRKRSESPSLAVCDWCVANRFANGYRL